MFKKLIINYIPEIKAFITGRKIPGLVSINLTENCNQHCIYCEIGKGIASENVGKLMAKDVKWVIGQMDAHNIKRLALCGGEPFLFNDLFDLVSFAGERNIKCWITSNGMTVHNCSIEELSILRKYRSEVNISIDSFDEKIENYVRGTRNALPNALKSVEKLLYMKIPVTLLCAISRYNFNNLFEYVRAACDMGVNQVLFQPIISFSNYPDRKTIESKSRLNVAEDDLPVLLKELKRISNYEKRHGISTNVYRILPWIGAYIKHSNRQKKKWFFDEVLNRFYCRDIYELIEINYNGIIQPCGLAEGIINIRTNNEKDLIELWKKATEDIKSDLKNGKFRDYCNGCCHHFSRNMIASIMKYPLQNRVALFKMLILITERVFWKLLKNLRKVLK